MSNYYYNHKKKSNKGAWALGIIAIIFALVAIVLVCMQYLTPSGQNLKPSEWIANIQKEDAAPAEETESIPGIAGVKTVSSTVNGDVTESIIEFTFTDGTTRRIVIPVQNGAKGDKGEPGVDGTDGVDGKDASFYVHYLTIAIDYQDYHLSTHYQLPTTSPDELTLSSFLLTIAENGFRKIEFQAGAETFGFDIRGNEFGWSFFIGSSIRQTASTRYVTLTDHGVLTQTN